jgi:hypothetical protein
MGFTRHIIGSSFLLLLSAGCTDFRFPNQLSDAAIDLTVKAAPEKGNFEISGVASLPEKTKITVAALRYLQPEIVTNQSVKSGLTFSVLAYDEVEVANGQWQTQLNLWEVAPDGRFQEAWQIIQPKLNLALMPLPDVVFVATLAPVERLVDLEQQLAQRGRRLPSDSLSITVDGEKYLRVEEVMAIALPNGKTTPPPVRPEDINDGWGNRFLLVPEPQNPVSLEFPTERQTNAPFKPEEILR